MSKLQVLSLEKTKSDLEDRLNRMVSEVTELQEKLDINKSRFDMEKSRLQDEISRLRKSESEVLSKLNIYLYTNYLLS